MSTVMVSILALYSYTQSTNNYNVILIGIPVAWAISDREDSDTIEVLFTVVKNKCPDAKVPTLMTDDGIFVCAATSNNLLLSMIYWLLPSLLSMSTDPQRCTELVYLSGCSWRSSASWSAKPLLFHTGSQESLNLASWSATLRYAHDYMASPLLRYHSILSLLL